MSTPVRWVSILAITTVALVAAVVSYAHMHALADVAGERWRAWLIPLSVDGMILIASLSIWLQRRTGSAGDKLAWCLLVVSLAASLSANIASAQHSLAGHLIAAWPPLALGGSFELFLRMARQPRTPVGRIYTSQEVAALLELDAHERAIDAEAESLASAGEPLETEPPANHQPPAEDTSELEDWAAQLVAAGFGHCSGCPGRHSPGARRLTVECGGRAEQRQNVRVELGRDILDINQRAVVIHGVTHVHDGRHGEPDRSSELACSHGHDGCTAGERIQCCPDEQ
ncbi:MAG: DUF2637 domain-containing protein [Sciscionella sp.]